MGYEEYARKMDETLAGSDIEKIETLRNELDLANIKIEKLENLVKEIFALTDDIVVVDILMEVINSNFELKSLKEY